MIRLQEDYIQDLLKHRLKSGKKCKKCNSENVYSVGPYRYLEHCRDCDNWQASF